MNLSALNSKIWSGSAEAAQSVIDEAVQLANKIVGESLEDEARQSRVVDRFLADLDADQGAPSGSRSSA